MPDWEALPGCGAIDERTLCCVFCRVPKDVGFDCALASIDASPDLQRLMTSANEALDERKLAKTSIFRCCNFESSSISIVKRLVCSACRIPGPFSWPAEQIDGEPSALKGPRQAFPLRLNRHWPVFVEPNGQDLPPPSPQCADQIHGAVAVFIENAIMAASELQAGNTGTSDETHPCGHFCIAAVLGQIRSRQHWPRWLLLLRLTRWDLLLPAADRYRLGLHAQSTCER